MIDLKSNYLYAKGTCNVVVRDIATGDVVLQSNKVNTNAFTTTCDLGEIRSGLGNPIAIQIPTNSAVNLEMELANLSMAGKAMQVGAKVNYNGIANVCETVTATDATLSVTGKPVAPYGFASPICNVVESGSTNASGEVYAIDPDTGAVEFTATAGKTYAVTYWERQASAEYFNISSNFAPGIYHVCTQIPVYSTQNTGNPMQGTHVGDLYHYIPRMQFSGKADTDGGQSANAVTSLSGTALSYDDAAAAGVCTDCAVSGLAQVVYVPLAGAAANVEGLVVVGGAVAVKVNETKQIPVRYLMPDGSTVQPNYGDMTYAVAAGGDSTAEVSATGVVMGKAAGETSVTIELTDKDLTAVCQVSVTA